MALGGVTLGFPGMISSKHRPCNSKSTILKRIVLDPQRRHCFSKGVFHQQLQGRLFGFNGGFLDFQGCLMMFFGSFFGGERC